MKVNGLLGSAELTLGGNDHRRGYKHDHALKIKNLTVLEAGTTS
jgi:hypothetical protein